MRLALPALVLLAGCYRATVPPDACQGVECSGRGRCVVVDGAPVCVCDDGYLADGVECVAPCEGVGCSGHGDCVVVDGSPACACDPGFEAEGLECVEDDPCEAVICERGEVCQHGTCIPADVDGDGDGFVARDDCDDSEPAVHPGAPELCNGVDDDCDRETDDGAGEPWIGEPCDGEDQDLCEEGGAECVRGRRECGDRTDGACDLPLAPVPAGTFWMGCNPELYGDCDGFMVSDTRPYHEVYLDAYDIGTTEVTVDEYGRCVDVGACDSPGSDDRCNWPHRAERGDHPVNCVRWDQADAYCQWAEMRLCTEAEWEKAALGTDGRRYPWGDEEASCERDVLLDSETGIEGCGSGGTLPARSKRAGASPYGVLGMTGNVSEWVHDWYDSTYYERSPRENPQGPPEAEYGRYGRVVRGGELRWPSWAMIFRIDFAPEDSYLFFAGFRCCRSR